MLGSHPMYGRLGHTAGGDSQVAELLMRTVENQFKTTRMFDETVSEIQANGFTPWTVPLPTMAVTHAEWLAAMLWQAATGYLDGVVQSSDTESLTTEAYTECDSMCDLAGRMTMEAIRLQSELDHGDRPPNSSLVSLPSLNIGGVGYVGIWGAFEAIYLQVTSDFTQIERSGVTRQMRDVYQTAQSAFQPKADVFEYLRSSWLTAITPESRRQLVREALPVITEMFVIGQQLWAPYLFGQVYVTALRHKPTLDELELGFDPWCLTDPQQRRIREDQKESKDELVQFWQAVVEPATAYQLSEQLRAALLTKRIRLRTGRGYNLIPWPSQFLVRFPIQLGGRSFASGDLVAFYAAEESGKYQIEVRRTGRANGIFEMLGQ